MNPSGRHPPHMDDTDTLYLGDQHYLVRNSVGFCFCLFLHLCLSVNSWHGSVIFVGSGFPIQGYYAQNHLVAPRSTQTFILTRLIKWVTEISGNLVVKSKLLPHDGSVALRKLNPIHQLGVRTPKIGYLIQMWG